MRIAFVAIQDPFTTKGGGQVRMAALIGVLERTGHEVVVLSPDSSGIHPRPRSIFHYLRIGPRQGSIRMLSGLTESIRDANPDLIVFSISYLAHYFQTDIPTAVDFQDIERDRYASVASRSAGYHKVLAWLESLKARYWEPRVARNATLSIACTEEEAGVLESWGARVLLMPHASDAVPLPASGNSHRVAYLASGGYPPNDDGGRWLIEEVWPLVSRNIPDAELRVFGFGTASSYAWVDDRSVVVLGEVDSVGTTLGDVELTVGPVRSGGGAQIKVITALAHGRAMVVTPYTLRSVPIAARDNVYIASSPEEFARAIVQALLAPDARREKEHRLANGSLSWETAGEPLAAWIEGHSQSRTPEFQAP